MAFKFGIPNRSTSSGARFSYSNVASTIVDAFTLESPEIREVKRREKVRSELVRSQFGIEKNDDDSPLVDRIGQMLKLD